MARRGGMVIVRIAHVVTKGDVGGAQTHVVELAAAQRAMGDEVVIVAGTDGPAMDAARRAGVDVVVVPALGRTRAGPGLSIRAGVRDVRRALVDVRPDIVHAHSSHAGLVARFIARRDGVASVYTAHGWPFQRGARRLQRMQSYLGELFGGRLGDGVICLTEAEAALARRYWIAEPERVWVVPNGLHDCGPSERRPSRGAGPVTLIMVARFAPPKLQRELIELLVHVPSVDWQIRFVGDGPELENCQTLAASAIAGRAEFLGFRDDVGRLLAEADLLLLWSRYEGLPISLLEGMRAGLACVASDLPGVRELFGESPAGQTAANGTELVRIVSELVQDRVRCDRLGEGTRRRYEAQYTVDKMCTRTRVVYESVLERRAR